MRFFRDNGPGRQRRRFFPMYGCNFFLIGKIRVLPYCMACDAKIFRGCLDNIPGFLGCCRVIFPRTMARLAGYAFKGIGARCRIISCGMALEAGELRTDLLPITLEYGRREGISMETDHPTLMDFAMTVTAELRPLVATILWIGFYAG